MKKTITTSIRFTIATMLLASSMAKAQTVLETKVLAAVQHAGFDHVIDYGPYSEACPGKSFCVSPSAQIKFAPNVDVAVIQLDANGQMVDRANVLLSRDYTNGLVVPL